MKISIITITYNNLDGLRLTAESVIAQTAFKEIEWVVVDGGSTDGTREFVLEELNSDRVTWLSGPDDGIYDALNKGVRRATGDWILCLNAGDMFCAADVVEKILRLSDLDDIDAIYSDGYVKNFTTGERFAIVTDRMKGVVHHQNLVYRRRLHSMYGEYLVTHPYIISDLLFMMRIPADRYLKVDFHIAISRAGGVSDDLWSGEQAAGLKVAMGIQSMPEAYSEYLEIKKSVDERRGFKGSAVVVIPVYKDSMSADEKLSLLQALKVLGRYRICFCCPDNLDMSPYESVAGGLGVERFPPRFFVGFEGYNNLMCSYEFYKRFERYDYILIYQLDAWVFDDRLGEWCSKGFDYIGAPWFENHSCHEAGKKLWLAGNGGLSLRRTAKFLEACNPSSKAQSLRQCLFGESGFFGWIRGLRHYCSQNTMADFRRRAKGRWEDVYFALGLQNTLHSMRIPGPQEAAWFSFECSPKYLYEAVTGGFLPFGCHAWRKWQYDEFWSKFIPKVSVGSGTFPSVGRLAAVEVASLPDTRCWILRKTIGGIRCLRENGLIYTIRKFFHKFFHKLKNFIAKVRVR